VVGGITLQGPGRELARLMLVQLFLNACLTIQPPYIGIELPSHRGEIDFKLGYYQGNEMISMKASSGGFKNNPEEYDVPNGMGTILLFDGRNGGPV